MQMRFHERLGLWAARRVWRITRGLTLGVRAAILDADGRGLLVRHGYMPGWHLPGGGVEKGESTLDALHREVAEETGLSVRGTPELFGLYTNFAAFPGDHIALYVVRSFDGEPTGATGLEIRERAFFPLAGLPETTGGQTRRRLAEITAGAKPSETW